MQRAWDNTTNPIENIKEVVFMVGDMGRDKKTEKHGARRLFRFQQNLLTATAGASVGACVLSASLLTAGGTCTLRSMFGAIFWINVFFASVDSC